ncbi:hypothetical protein ZWY2020_012073 [Hordeum vulgare]|uniref:Predicted protein n=2 Tax=Hordeum vulgare subsp. vulgare TaxID=112509 RepID=F2ECC3_HORVV|nr:hypothetical protein ZWY2020_012073 [Hordeum vulgare]BAK04995.1 predicted protein [Hordeum vulgare subsp. vulgare]
MAAAAPCASRRSFRDSLKVLESDIQHANTLASECSRDYDGASPQMRMSYSPAAHIFLFFLLLQPRRRAPPPQDPHLLYKVYVDGTTPQPCPPHQRKAGQHQGILRCDVALTPSLMQLEHGVSGTDDRRQRAVCSQRYMRRDG